MKPYSDDLRIRVLRAYLNHEGSMRKIAERFDVSLSFVLALVKQHKETGSIQPRPRGGGQKLRVDDQGVDALSQLILAHPEATLQELCTLFEENTGLKLSVATMSRSVRRVRQKSPSNPPPLRRRGRRPKKDQT